MHWFVRGWLAVGRSLAQGFTRSLVLLVVTGFAPGLWAAAAVFFYELLGSIVPAAWCVFGVVAGSLAIFARPVCRAVRFLVARWTGAAIPDAYGPSFRVTRMATGYWWNGYDYQRIRWVSVCQRWIQTRVRDTASWRDMLWMVIAPPTVGVAAALPLLLIAGGAGAAAGWAVPVLSPLLESAASRVTIAVMSIALGVLLLPLGWRLAVPMARRLLGPSALVRLASRVTTLVQARADLTQAQDAELHRIERALHDGAQARLVSIGMSLGAAERLVDTDPAEAKELLRQTRETSRVALRELRDLAHGIAPPVLVERGLVDAIRALALDAPLRAEVHSTLEHRLEMPLSTSRPPNSSPIPSSTHTHRPSPSPSTPPAMASPLSSPTMGAAAPASVADQVSLGSRPVSARSTAPSRSAALPGVRRASRWRCHAHRRSRRPLSPPGRTCAAARGLRP